MSVPVLHGPHYSVYTRSVRIALVEKGIDHRLEEVDFIGAGAMPAEQEARHPFGMVPTLSHEGRTFFETLAIHTYLEAAFPDRPLMPSEAGARAGTVAAILAFDNYIWPEIRDLVTQRVFASIFKQWPDDSVISRAVRRLDERLPKLEKSFALAPHVVGSDLSLADLHIAPMVDYLQMTPEGAGLLAKSERLGAWWQAIRERDSVVATPFDLDAYGWTSED